MYFFGGKRKGNTKYKGKKQLHLFSCINNIRVSFLAVFHFIQVVVSLLSCWDLPGTLLAL